MSAALAGQLDYEFHGMSPSDWTDKFLNDEFSSLMEWAPKDASLRLRVERHSDGIDGTLLMNSTAGTFKVEFKAPDITTLTKGLKKKMKARVHKWKDSGHHFSHSNHRAG